MKKDPAAVALGRKGGKARLKKLSAEQRRQIASKGGQAFAAKMAARAAKKRSK